jgi:hypothetical protein
LSLEPRESLGARNNFGARMNPGTVEPIETIERKGPRWKILKTKHSM